MKDNIKLKFNFHKNILKKFFIKKKLIKIFQFCEYI